MWLTKQPSRQTHASLTGLKSTSVNGKYLNVFPVLVLSQTKAAAAERSVGPHRALHVVYSACPGPWHRRPHHGWPHPADPEAHLAEHSAHHGEPRCAPDTSPHYDE